MVSLVKKHLNEVATQLVDMRRFVLNRKPRCGWLGAGRNAPPASLYGANPAASLVPQTLMVAEPWNIDTALIGRLHDRLAFHRGYLCPIDRKGEFTHSPKSLSKI